LRLRFAATTAERDGVRILTGHLADHLPSRPRVALAVGVIGSLLTVARSAGDVSSRHCSAAVRTREVINVIAA
jgi:hypothetical protein